MPFTFYHLGPALAFGLPLRKFLHLPTFIVANVILDIEPLLVMMYGLNYPLHGYLHTVLSAVGVGLLLGFVMFKLEGHMKNFYFKLQLENNSLRLRSFLVAGIFGALLHMFFDSLLYSEMKPLFPLLGNSLSSLGVSLSSVYTACFWLGVLGVAFYCVILVYSFVKKH